MMDFWPCCRQDGHLSIAKRPEISALITIRCLCVILVISVAQTSFFFFKLLISHNEPFLSWCIHFATKFFFIIDQLIILSGYRHVTCQVLTPNLSVMIPQTETWVAPPQRYHLPFHFPAPSGNYICIHVHYLDLWSEDLCFLKLLVSHSNLLHSFFSTTHAS